MSEVKYDDLKVTMETKETPESHLLLVHIPEGFQRHNIGAKVEFDYRRIRVFGELPPEKNVIKRFIQVYQVPETCDINNITGKFEGRIVIITMRKKEISMVPDQKSQPVPAQEAPKTLVQETKPETEQDNKDHDDTPPQPQLGEHKRQEPPTDEEEEDQKGQKGKYQEEEPAPDKEEDQKGQESLSKQDSKSTTEYKEEADTKTPTKPEDKEESKPEITDQKGITQEATSNDAQRDDEKSTGMTTDGKEEKPREEETKTEIDSDEKIFEQEKQLPDDEETLVDKSPSIVINRKRKASSALVPYIPESTTKRITTILEDKQKLIYMGAAFAVVALGVYVSYKLRSSARH